MRPRGTCLARRCRPRPWNNCSPTANLPGSCRRREVTLAKQPSSPVGRRQVAESAEAVRDGHLETYGRSVHLPIARWQQQSGLRRPAISRQLGRKRAPLPASQSALTRELELEPVSGFEPPTRRLRSGCSTTELHRLRGSYSSTGRFAATAPWQGGMQTSGRALA